MLVRIWFHLSHATEISGDLPKELLQAFGNISNIAEVESLRSFEVLMKTCRWHPIGKKWGQQKKVEAEMQQGKRKA